MCASPLKNWLRNNKDVYRLHREELDEIEDAEMRYRRLVELNVIERCINVFKTGLVQRRRAKTHDSKEFANTQPKIHPVVFDPKTGYLKKLEADLDKGLSELYGIYDIYQADSK